MCPKLSIPPTSSNPSAFSPAPPGKPRAASSTFRAKWPKSPTASAVGIGDIEAQTRQVLDNLARVLANVGGRLDDIVKVTVFVTDMAHLDQIHRVRAEYFTPPYPASTLVEVSRLVRPEYLIEIDAVASIPYERVQ